MLAYAWCAAGRSALFAHAMSCEMCDAPAQVACKGCGVSLFCSKDHRLQAFLRGIVHPVVAHEDSTSGYNGRETVSPKFCTLLCGGDKGNAIRGILRGDSSLCTGLASIQLGHTHEQGDEVCEDVADNDDRVLEEACQWPAVAPAIPDPAPVTRHLVRAEFLGKTRVEDTGEMGRVLRAAVDMELGEVALREAPLLVWPTGVSSQVEYYTGVLDAYMAAPASVRAAVDDLCHPCPLDRRGEIGRRYRAYAYILWQLHVKAWRSSAAQECDAGQSLALTASKIHRLIASIDCNAIGYGSEDCAVFAS